MLLSDKTIQALLDSGDVSVVPMPKATQMQPISIDLTLGNSWCRETTEPDNMYNVRAKMQVIRPGEFLLASTEERIRLPHHVAGFVHGKSSWARRGLVVESAGLVDPGFDGTITMELFNMSSHPIPLTAGMPICQISFQLLDTAVLRPYGSLGLGSHYQGQVRAEPARG